MKLEKEIVDRRIRLMESEGIKFVKNADVEIPFPRRKYLTPLTLSYSAAEPKIPEI